MEITLGSLFDGIGGFPLCAEWNGIVPLWASEIEKVPIEITKKHFPDMKHLGDITKIDGAKIEPVDVITFGSPCQDLSIAGKRKGLEGERSGLFKSAVNIIRKMQSSTGGQYPRYAVWENVPGAFSSNKGLDFRTVLEEITKTEIPMPSGGKWAEAGMVECPNCQVAWRTMDAQFWGVPQRRKRIYLVADFRGRCAGEILFKPESVSRYFAEGSGEREGIAGSVEVGVRTTSDRNITFAKISSTLRAGAGAPKHFQDYTGRLVATKSNTVCLNMANPSNEPNYNLAPTLCSRMGTGGNQVPVILQPILFEPRSPDGTPNYKVRRLTPTECERLQGFPDKWTDGFADALRYKALGNSLALVNANFVISRIAKKLSSQALLDK